MNDSIFGNNAPIPRRRRAPANVPRGLLARPDPPAPECTVPAQFVIVGPKDEDRRNTRCSTLI